MDLAVSLHSHNPSRCCAEQQPLHAAGTADCSAGHRYDAKEEVVQAALCRAFAFSFVWAIGGNLIHTVREDFDAFAREHLAPLVVFPGGGTVFDYFVELKGFPQVSSVPSLHAVLALC
jgi:hypothetical protein